MFCLQMFLTCAVDVLGFDSLSVCRVFAGSDCLPQGVVGRGESAV